MTGRVLDWSVEARDQTYEVHLGQGDLNLAQNNAFRWNGAASSAEAARRLALADARRAFAVQAAMRGAKARFPITLATDRRGWPETTTPEIQVGQAMLAVLDEIGPADPPWSAARLRQVGRAALRSVAARAKLPTGNDGIMLSCSNRFDSTEWRRAQISALRWTRDAGGLVEGKALATPAPLRAVLVALALATLARRIALRPKMEDQAETGEITVLEIPGSAVLRTALQVQLEDERAANAAIVAGFLREAGLSRDATAFQAAYGD